MKNFLLPSGRSVMDTPFGAVGQVRLQQVVRDGKVEGAGRET